MIAKTRARSSRMRLSKAALEKLNALVREGAGMHAVHVALASRGATYANYQYRTYKPRSTKICR